MRKENRLLKNKDFKNVLDARDSVACGEFVVYKKNNELDHARVGISVSSKIGNSVIRHKVKRQISEMVKELVDINFNIDVVIIVRNRYLSNDFSVNKESLKKCLKKFDNRRNIDEKN